MKGTFTDILEKFAVDRALSPYESAFWQADKDDRTCSAEVRMNAYADAFEAEIQMMEGEKVRQVLWCEVKPQQQGNWMIVAARFKGDDYVNAVYDWDEKIGKFFRAVVRALKTGEVPDLEEIERTEMKDSGTFGDRKGDGSGRNVKINTNSLLYDMKRGGHGM